MTTSSRRLSQKHRPNRPSHTPGREKGATCQKSALKTFGQKANPYKLKGYAAKEYARYCEHTRELNK